MPLEELRQGYLKASGTVLRRIDSPEGERRLNLLLKGIGPVWATAPGAARGRGRFGGATEPLVWGAFSLYKGPRRLYLREVEVKEDFWNLRKSRGSLQRAMEWSRWISRNTMEGHSCDSLIGLFFWSLRNLEQGAEGDVAEWRFFWKWLRLFGVAPELDRCAGCGQALEGAIWTEDALLCPRCITQGSGLRVDPALLRQLYSAVMLSRNRFIEWSQQLAKTGDWLSCNQRLRSLLIKSL